MKNKIKFFIITIISICAFTSCTVYDDYPPRNVYYYPNGYIYRPAPSAWQYKRPLPPPPSKHHHNPNRPPHNHGNHRR